MEVIQRKALHRRKALRLFRQSLAEQNLRSWSALSQPVRDSVASQIEASFRDAEFVHKVCLRLSDGKPLTPNRLVRCLANMVGFRALLQACS